MAHRRRHLTGAIIAATVAVAGSTVTAKADLKGAPHILSPEEIALIQAGVAADLKDPESARFGEIGAAKSGIIIWVCGYVNAKNSFGGYVGMQPFYGAIIQPPGKSPDFTANRVGGSAAEIRTTLTMCDQFGIKM